mmetsp:Transcript_2840/g.5176  ORF Transcript_2840/g.5176 Transcript_2840/m.5176 type:complete len:413 (-) Transcript_2840:41-1279(-)
MNFNKHALRAAMYADIDEQDMRDAEEVFGLNKTERAPKFFYKRLNWNEHIEMCRQTKGFSYYHHMTEEAFNQLVEILREDITCNYIKSRNSTGGNEPIYPELVCMVGVRFMGGELIKSLAGIGGMDPGSANRVLHKFLLAVDMCEHPDLALVLPTTEDAFAQVARKWSVRSDSFGLMDGFLGAIDGWLCCMEKPTLMNAADYFSGHYQRFGLNVQAMCDANLLFMYVGVAAPGKTNDLRAFNRLIELKNWFDELPPNYFVGGDNAYPLQNSLLIPFSGAERFEPYKRSYNFLLSQLRIRIEMAFGRLTTKWRIFRSNLGSDVELNSQIVRVGFKLHNFVIRAENLSFNIPDTNRDALGIEPIEDGPIGNNGFLELAETYQQGDGMGLRSARRNWLLEEITVRGIIVTDVDEN